MAEKKAKLTEHSLGVILESIDSKVEQVLEGHAALDKKFDKKIDEFRGEFREFANETKLNFEAVKDYLSRVDEEIQDLRKTITGKVEVQRLEHLEKEVAEIKLAIQKWQKSQ